MIAKRSNRTPNDRYPEQSHGIGKIFVDKMNQVCTIGCAVFFGEFHLPQIWLRGMAKID